MIWHERDMNECSVFLSFFRCKLHCKFVSLSLLQLWMGSGSTLKAIRMGTYLFLVIYLMIQKIKKTICVKIERKAKKKSSSCLCWIIKTKMCFHEMSALSMKYDKFVNWLRMRMSSNEIHSTDWTPILNRIIISLRQTTWIRFRCSCWWEISKIY